MDLVPNLIVIDPDHGRLWIITQSGVRSLDDASAAILSAREPTQVRLDFTEFTQYRMAAGPPVIAHPYTVSRATDIIVCVLSRAAVGETRGLPLREIGSPGGLFARTGPDHRPAGAATAGGPGRLRLATREEITLGLRSGSRSR